MFELEKLKDKSLSFETTFGDKEILNFRSSKTHQLILKRKVLGMACRVNRFFVMKYSAGQRVDKPSECIVTVAHGRSQLQRNRQCVAGFLGRNKISNGGG
ncbi:hypothetical protein EVAR_96452_1 [Eumeta japonica]|uniref:Uncharacterized protein n=1 Tax=Eumeta variegata TaxID=151549 RepID=A0A4C1VYR1_EUMVA|nr:hypothetical protein EVAR_96452_1 [Eumeta japonica]